MMQHPHSQASYSVGINGGGGGVGGITMNGTSYMHMNGSTAFASPSASDALTQEVLLSLGLNPCTNRSDLGEICCEHCMDRSYANQNSQRPHQTTHYETTA